MKLKNKKFYLFLDEKVEGISNENKLYFIDSKFIKVKEDEEK